MANPVLNNSPRIARPWDVRITDPSFGASLVRQNVANAYETWKESTYELLTGGNWLGVGERFGTSLVMQEATRRALMPLVRMGVTAALGSAGLLPFLATSAGVALLTTLAVTGLQNGWAAYHDKETHFIHDLSIGALFSLPSTILGVGLTQAFAPQAQGVVLALFDLATELPQGIMSGALREGTDDFDFDWRKSESWIHLGQNMVMETVDGGINNILGLGAEGVTHVVATTTAKYKKLKSNVECESKNVLFDQEQNTTLIETDIYDISTDDRQTGDLFLLPIHTLMSDDTDAHIPNANLALRIPDNHSVAIQLNRTQLIGTGTSGFVFRGSNDDAYKIFHEAFDVRESRELAYATTTLLKSLGLPVVEITGRIQAKVDTNFKLNQVDFKTSSSYDGFRMKLLPPEKWTLDFTQLRIEQKKYAQATLKHIVKVLEDNGLGYSGGEIQCLFNRTSGDVVLIDPAELQIFNPHLFQQKYLSRFQKITIARQESTLEQQHRENSGDPFYDDWVGAD